MSINIFIISNEVNGITKLLVKNSFNKIYIAQILIYKL